MDPRNDSTRSQPTTRTPFLVVIVSSDTLRATMHFVTSGDFPGIRAAHARGLVPRPCTDLSAPVNSLRRLIRIIANVWCMRSSK